MEVLWFFAQHFSSFQNGSSSVMLLAWPDIRIERFMTGKEIFSIVNLAV